MPTIKDLKKRLDDAKPDKPGYHLSTIVKGILGESSKIKEELDELIDAEQQGVKLMVLQELSDLIGAVKRYLVKNFGNTITLQDLIDMAVVTQRAFESGHRK